MEWQEDQEFEGPSVGCDVIDSIFAAPPGAEQGSRSEEQSGKLDGS